jgi:hypothetical protein
MPHIGAYEVGVGTQRAQLIRQVHADVIAPAGHEDSGAIARECKRGGAADAGQCACDENYRARHLDTLLWW